MPRRSGYTGAICNISLSPISLSWKLILRSDDIFRSSRALLFVLNLPSSPTIKPSGLMSLFISHVIYWWQRSQISFASQLVTFNRLNKSGNLCRKVLLVIAISRRDIIPNLNTHYRYHPVIVCSEQRRSTIRKIRQCYIRYFGSTLSYHDIWSGQIQALKCETNGGKKVVLWWLSIANNFCHRIGYYAGINLPWYVGEPNISQTPRFLEFCLGNSKIQKFKEKWSRFSYLRHPISPTACITSSIVSIVNTGCV